MTCPELPVCTFCIRVEYYGSFWIFVFVVVECGKGVRIYSSPILKRYISVSI